jgi:hypothetical protein
METHLSKTVQLAREAGAIILDGSDTTVIDRLVALVRADEREACAKFADQYMRDSEGKSFGVGDAIRARGNT